MRVTFFCLICLCLIVFSGCHKDAAVGAPSETDYIHFNVNGVPFSQFVDAQGKQELRAWFPQGYPDTTFSGMMIETNGLIGKSIVSISIHLFGLSSDDYVTGIFSKDFLSLYEEGSGPGFITQNPSGTVDITFFDKNQHIIAGTFQFHASNGLPNGTRDITNGRFSVHYTQ